MLLSVSILDETEHGASILPFAGRVHIFSGPCGPDLSVAFIPARPKFSRLRVCPPLLTGKVTEVGLNVNVTRAFFPWELLWLVLDSNLWHWFLHPKSKDWEFPSWLSSCKPGQDP